MGEIDALLNLTGIALGGLLAFILMRQKIYREFRFFSLYVCCSVVVEIARLAVLADYKTYFKVFWATEALYAALRLLALHEIFRRVFQGFYSRPWFRFRFPAVALLALLIATWTALYHSPAHASPLIRLILFFGLAVSFMQVCLFGLFVFLAKSFNLHWRFAPLGVLVGFTLSGFGGTFAYWLVSEFGTKFGSFGKYAPPVTYLLAVVVWLLTFLKPEPEPRWTSQATPGELAAAIRSETEFLKGILDRRK